MKKHTQISLALGIGIVVFLGLCATPALAQNPAFMVTSALNATVPFNLTMPSTTPSGAAVKTVEINFVTADCAAAPGVGPIGSAQITVTFQGQNGFYHLGFAPAQAFVNETDFVLAQTTLMFADPGTPVNFGITGLEPNCTVVMSGHLIPK